MLGIRRIGYRQMELVGGGSGWEKAKEMVANVSSQERSKWSLGKLLNVHYLYSAVLLLS